MYMFMPTPIRLTYYCAIKCPHNLYGLWVLPNAHIRVFRR